ncbi:MAG TPA: RNA methyltransferase [Salinibacter sp.]|nr:RNA methyltransferase [Salinibacter sp.]
MNRHEIDAEREMNRLLDAGGTPPVDGDPFRFGETRLSPDRIISLLQPHMTDRRLRRIRAVVAERTRTVVPVVEGLVNTGNVSAVMRSAEALGYQDFHVVKGNNERYKHSERAASGAQQWLDVWRWDGPSAAATHLHDEGYQIVAMHLHADTVPIRELDFTAPTALVFGNEEEGVTDAMMEEADAACVVPLPGFTESFNVSVAAAVALYHAQQHRIDRQGHHADLSEEEQTRLVARFCLRSVTEPEKIIERKLSEEA